MSPRNITTENPSRDVRRFLQHWSDADFVVEQLSARFPKQATATRRQKSKTVAGCVAQALQYLAAAEVTPLLTKPLPMFYAAENLAKATAIATAEPLTSADFKSHGVSGDDARRNSIRNLRCKIQKPGKDTWSRFYAAANCDLVVLARTVDGIGQTTRAPQLAATVPPRPGSDLLFGELIKHLPELVDDVSLVGWGHSYVVHLASISHCADYGAA
jgi:hypothetical protein